MNSISRAGEGGNTTLADWTAARFSEQGGALVYIGAAGIAVQGTNLRVEAVDTLAARIPGGEKIAKIIVDLALILFYIMVYRSGRLFSAKSMIIKVSTMPQYKMGQVYSIFPWAALLCIVAAAVHLLVTLTEPRAETPREVVAHEFEGKEGAQ